jgi:ABC-2 type transport system permease protein
LRSERRHRAYVRLLAAQVRSQTQYRLSFGLDLFFSTVLTSLDLVALWVLFAVNGSLGGFGGVEVLLMAGIAAASFPLADLAVGNVEKLRVYVRSGLFDALLLRPLSALGQLVAMDFAPRRIGRVCQGVAIYVVALTVAPVQWSVPAPCSSARSSWPARRSRSGGSTPARSPTPSPTAARTSPRTR